MADRIKLIFDDDNSDVTWVVVYYHGQSEFDDDMTDSNTTEVMLAAEDIETAFKYAQQYLRKMQSEEQTANEWSDTEILSIERY